MRRRNLAHTLGLVTLAACTVTTPPGSTAALPDGAGGIGFDDLRYSATLHRVLAPAGRTGTLALVDPDTLAVTTIPGFRAAAAFSATPDDGPTSVDEGRGLLFVTDRTAGTLSVVDATAGKVVASAPVASTPGYVRYVATTDEVWVTEPASHQLEIFTLGGGTTPTSAGTIPVADGPVSLAVDASAGRAYTHRTGTTVVLDVRTRARVAEWSNGCTTSQGIALDPARGLLLAGCADGTLSVLDSTQDGHVLGSLAKGSGGSVLGYSSTLGHAYQAGSGCACLVVFGVPGNGVPTVLGQLDAPSTTRCATADDRGHAWICDPQGGQLFRVDDPYPSSL